MIKNLIAAPVINLLLGLALFAPACAHAESVPASCGGAEPVRVTITPVFDEIQYEFYNSMLNIKDLAAVQDKRGQQEHWPIGLATGELFVRMNMEIQSKSPRGDIGVCSSLKSFDIQVGFSDNKVYVARELPKRSCPHRVVLDHEQTHKKVDYDLLVEYTERAKAYFEEAANAAGMHYQRDGKNVDAEFNELLNSKLKAFTDEMHAERIKRQNLVDTESEYDRVAASCDGQLKEIINDRLDQFKSSDPGLIAKYKMLFSR
jgi:hypothetical protein